MLVSFIVGRNKVFNDTFTQSYASDYALTLMPLLVLPYC